MCVFFFFTDSRTQGAAGDTFGRSQGKKKKKPKFVQKSPLVLALMLSFWSSQFGNAAQRVWGSASHRSGQFGRFLPSQRRCDFSPLLVYNILMLFLSSQNHFVSDCQTGASSHRKTPLGTPLVASAGRCFSPLSVYQAPPIKEEEPVPATVAESGDMTKVLTQSSESWPSSQQFV